MDCERLERLVKAWYLQVQDETMAPARMVTFMKNHLEDCPVCLADPIVTQEVDKIIEIVLPPAKIRKANKEEKGDTEEEPVAVKETAKEDAESGDGGGGDIEEEEDY